MPTAVPPAAGTSRQRRGRIRSGLDCGVRWALTTMVATVQFGQEKRSARGAGVSPSYPSDARDASGPWRAFCIEALFGPKTLQNDKANTFGSRPTELSKASLHAVRSTLALAAFSRRRKDCLLRR
jgi:hypothetical protein